MLILGHSCIAVEFLLYRRQPFPYRIVQWLPVALQQFLRQVPPRTSPEPNERIAVPESDIYRGPIPRTLSYLMEASLRQPKCE
jgi:hypothetical protein